MMMKMLLLKMMTMKVVVDSVVHSAVGVVRLLMVCCVSLVFVAVSLPCCACEYDEEMYLVVVGCWLGRRSCYVVDRLCRCRLIHLSTEIGELL